MSRPYRIGYVVNTYPKLSETFILREILELERQGVDVTIFSVRRPNEGRFHPDVCRVKARAYYVDDAKAQKWWKPLRAHWDHLQPHLPRLWSLMEELIAGDSSGAMDNALKGAAVAAQAAALGLDGLHAHFANTSSSVAHFANRVSGIPYSFTAHAKDIFTDDVDVEHLSDKIRGARFVITVSEYNRRFMLERCTDVPPERIRVLYNGMDLSFFKPEDRKPVADDPLIVGVGRLVAKKGFADLLRACAVLKDRGCRFRCRIVGEGREAAPLGLLRTELGLQDCVELPGAANQDAVRELLSRATILCQPCVRDDDGNQDALPTVLLESLAAGVPIVTTRLAGIPEIVENEREGLVVEPGDVPAFADAMQRLLEDGALRSRFAEAGRQKAETRFDIRRNVAVLHSYYAEDAAPGAAREITDSPKQEASQVAGGGSGR